MAIRADMIGPRRLQPSGSYQQTIFQFAQEQNPLTDTIGPITTLGMQNGVVPGCHMPPPPTPHQPALIIRDDLVNKSFLSYKDLKDAKYNKKMEKAIRGHIDAMVKAGDITRKIGHSELTPSTSVATPQHEHARLTAKKQYLEEKLDAHARAMHQPNHPEVAHRTKVLNQVNQNLSRLESKGIKSGPKHHEDWINHYAGLGQNDPSKASRMSQDEINTALHAHTGALASPTAKQMRLEVAGTHRGAQKTEMNPSIPPLKESEMSPMGPRGEDVTRRITSSSMKPAMPIPTQESYTKQQTMGMGKGLYIQTGFMFKSDGKKSDEWISAKIKYLMEHENKKQDQAIAIAYSMAGRGKKDTNKSIPLFVER